MLVLCLALVLITGCIGQQPAKPAEEKTNDTAPPEPPVVEPPKIEPPKPNVTAPPVQQLSCPRAGCPAFKFRTIANSTGQLCFNFENKGNGPLEEKYFYNTTLLIDGKKVAWKLIPRVGITLQTTLSPNSGVTNICTCTEYTASYKGCESASGIIYTHSGCGTMNIELKPVYGTGEATTYLPKECIG